MLRLFLILIFWVASFFLPAGAQEVAAEGNPPTSQALRTRLQALEARVQRKEAPVDPQNLALLRFKIEQAHLLFQSIESNEPSYVLSSPYDETKLTIDQNLTRAESIARATGDAVYPSLSQMHERAYIAQADGSVQPYWVFVPRDYTPRRKWPLVVFLHGYDPFLTKIKPWIPGPDIWEPATRRGFIMAVPYGRRNSDFVGIGEDDTLAVTEAVSARYNVERERTFLLGPSMGGYGVHTIGLHHPDRFAALAPMCARTDFYLWFNLEREKLPPWKRILYDADDPRHLKRNAFSLPIFMQHGELDSIVPVEHSRRFYADLKELNYPVTYREIPNGSHFIYWQYQTFDVAAEWMSRVLPAPLPRRVRYSSGSLRNHKSYWLSILGFEDYAKLAHIDAEIKGGNIVEVKTENVSQFELRLPPQFLDATTAVTLVVNGEKVAGEFPAEAPIRWHHPFYSLRLKTPQLSGPIKEVYRDPFLLVYGTAKDDADEKAARRFLKEWYDFADGKPPIKADNQVTEEDKSRFNLILFGTRESNSLLSTISNQLPLELTPTGYRFGETQYAAGDAKLGLQLCYPSPFDSQRMIVVQSGLYWGGALPVNHKFDLLPEYIVFDEALDVSDQTNRALVAGFFNDEWKIDNARTQEEVEVPFEVINNAQPVAAQE